jgi:hypothetical protein
MGNLNSDIPLNDTEEKTELSVPLRSRREFLCAAATNSGAATLSAEFRPETARASTDKVAEVAELVLPPATKAVTPFEVHVPEAAALAEDFLKVAMKQFVDTVTHDISSWLAEKLVRRLGDQLALVAGAGKFDCTGLPLTLPAGDRRGAIWCAADDFVQRHLPLVAVREADDNHAEVQQVGDDRERGRFLTAVLGGTRSAGES